MMKLRITMKDPDGVYDSVWRYAEQHYEERADLEAEEKGMLIEARVDMVNEMLRKWVRFGEYLTIEVDTEKATAKVVEQ